MSLRDIIRGGVAAAVGFGSRSLLNSPLSKAVALTLGSIDDAREIQTTHGRILIGVSNPLERWRSETLLTKEPETIAWIDETIRSDSVLYDIGANIGIYTLYALRANPGVRAVAFEPEALNFARLNLNLHRNGWSARAMAFALALGDHEGEFIFRVSTLEAGRAMHGDNIGSHLPDHAQGCVCKPLDAVAFGALALPRPTHLKIDVDGPELDVLRGAERCLRLPELRHILVEVTDAHRAQVTALLSEHGFELIAEGPVSNAMGNLIFAKP